MNQNRSVATIDAPEFINLTEDALNPGISKCEIKVFYLGKNRNGSFIDKNVAIQMANSLPGTPIVGAYRKDIEDFGDHGHVIHIENGEVQFSCSTIPYGFVAPDARCWFKKFEDTDEMGNSVIREYLMTTGYLWTGQYPELESCIDEGKGQSMELDPENLNGHWATSNNDGIEFFIINDAIFSKLCILGDDVEPCFEGAAVTSPEVSANFANNPEFTQTLYTMMNELIFALKNKGGSDMPEDTIQEQEEIVTEEVTEEVEEPTSEETETEEGNADETTSEDAGDAEESDEAEDAEDGEDADDAGEDAGSDFACGGGDKKKKYTEDDDDDEEEEAEEKKEESDDSDSKKKKASSEHSLEEFETLKADFEAMKAELEELRDFKLSQENAKKDALFNKYFMLSDEEKAPIKEKKSEFSLEQIEEKLALLYVRKNVNFESVDGSFQEEEEVEDPAFSFSLEDNSAGFVPPVVEALRRANQK